MIIGFITSFSRIAWSVVVTSRKTVPFSQILNTLSHEKYSPVCHLRFIFGTKMTVGSDSEVTISVKSLVFPAPVGSLISHLVSHEMRKFMIDIMLAIWDFLRLLFLFLRTSARLEIMSWRLYASAGLSFSGAFITHDIASSNLSMRRCISGMLSKYWSHSRCLIFSYISLGPSCIKWL